MSIKARLQALEKAKARATPQVPAAPKQPWFLSDEAYLDAVGAWLNDLRPDFPPPPPRPPSWTAEQYARDVRLFERQAMVSKIAEQGVLPAELLDGLDEEDCGSVQAFFAFTQDVIQAGWNLQTGELGPGYESEG